MATKKKQGVASATVEQVKYLVKNQRRNVEFQKAIKKILGIIG